MYRFGPSWQARAADGMQVCPTPHSEVCSVCREGIFHGDRGMAQALLSPDEDPPVRVIYQHAECFLMSVIGHDKGFCHCTGYDTSSRATARLVWQAAGHDR